MFVVEEAGLVSFAYDIKPLREPRGVYGLGLPYLRIGNMNPKKMSDSRCLESSDSQMLKRAINLQNKTKYREVFYTQDRMR